MTEEDKLDLIISHLKQRKDDTFINFRDFTRLAKEIPEDEIHHLMEIMQSDKNVVIQKLPIAYRITPRGKSFKGYVKMKRERKLWKWIKRIGIVIGIIGGIITINKYFQ